MCGLALHLNPHLAHKEGLHNCNSREKKAKNPNIPTPSSLGSPTFPKVIRQAHLEKILMRERAHFKVSEKAISFNHLPTRALTTTGP